MAPHPDMNADPTEPTWGPIGNHVAYDAPANDIQETDETKRPFHMIAGTNKTSIATTTKTPIAYPNEADKPYGTEPTRPYDVHTNGTMDQKPATDQETRPSISVAKTNDDTTATRMILEIANLAKSDRKREWPHGLQTAD